MQKTVTLINRQRVLSVRSIYLFWGGGDRGAAASAYSISQQNEIATHTSGGPPSMAINSDALDEILLSFQLDPITSL